MIRTCQLCLPVALLLALAACKTAGALPDRSDIEAATEAKPRPSAAILVDPAADARHNASIEAWGDRVRAAGLRLCRFYERTGMEKLVCPIR